MIGVRCSESGPASGCDAVGRADLRSLENLCRTFPSNRFLVSVLSARTSTSYASMRENSATSCPSAVGWFMNNPSIVEEITRERIEMLGASFIPQHSDARVLEQVIYKWSNTRRTVAPILSNAYRLLAEDGRGVTRATFSAMSRAYSAPTQNLDEPQRH